MSPDGRWIFSVDRVQTLRVWEARSGAEQAVLAGTGGFWCLDTHPLSPRLACGDGAGAVRLIDLIGIDYGPLAVTAFDTGRGLVVRCPACHSFLSGNEVQRGQPVVCRNRHCRTNLSVNAAALPGDPRPPPAWWRWLTERAPRRR